MNGACVDAEPATGSQSLDIGHRSFLGFRSPVLSSKMGLLAEILLLTTAYFVCGKFGLSLAFVHESASAVWPPTGLALAALLLWGYRLWPGVFLGAFLVNITTTGSLPICLGMAAGNTGEALLGAWLVCRFAGGLQAVQRTNTFFRFALLAGVISTALSPAVGVTSLCLGRFASWDQYQAIWLTWWLGDMVSNLILAPLVLIWVRQGIRRLKARRLLEAIGVLVVVILVSLALFLARNSSVVGSHPLTYLALLPLVLAAFRFGERGAVTAAFVVDGIAIWGTLHGWGPFASSDTQQSLLFLQIFIGTAGVTAVTLGLAISERRRAEQLLLMKCVISRQLAEASRLDEALTQTLASLCSDFSSCLWDAAAFWTIDTNNGALRCSHAWHAPWNGAIEFASVNRQTVLTRGVSLPGRVWASGEPAWIADLKKLGNNCPRAAHARNAGLNGACAFPVRGSKESIAIIELYSREPRAPDPELMRVFLAVGTQMGLSIERKFMEERLALVIQGSSDGVWDWDLTANEVYFSSRWKSMLGYAENEVEHRFSAWERLLHPADRERALASVQAYLAGQTSTFELEHRLRHKDGSYRWILSRGFALRDASGKPVRMAGSHVDLTVRKETEEQLRRAYVELSENEAALKAALQELRTLHQELQAAQLQLIQAAKLESVGTLAAGVAHEVKNPLQTILMGLDYVANNVNRSDQNTLQVLSDMRDAVTRANTIIRELLQLSAAADFELREVDLNPLVEHSLWLVNNEVVASHITVVRRLGADLPRVRLDPGKMEQVFINLFLNALQAMSQHGLLTVTTRHRRFGADLNMNGPAFAEFKSGDPVVIAEVQDTGKGIPEANLPKIFDPFFTTKPNGVGTGLGLSVVKKIMDLHGGAIDIRNAALGGVVVTLILKAAP
jgi:PAS domain S-box-containing protein